MMLFSNPSSVYLYNEAVDMRKSIDGLSYFICDSKSHSPQNGSVTIFYNKSIDAKQLSWLLAGLDYELMHQFSDLYFSDYF